MNNKDSEIHVSFVGGLGNQLFQYANAMMLNPNGKIIASSISPEPSAKFLVPEVVNYANLEADQERFFKNRLGIRMHNLVLRNSSFENRHPDKKLIGKLIQSLTVFFLRYILDKSPKIHFQTNLGFQPRRQNSTPYQMLQIGYFQHSHWASDSKVTNQLNRLNLKNPSAKFQETFNELTGRNILMIHMRFGDYLNEKLFGMPTVEYFRKSIDVQIGANSFDRVVVFTNGERNAVKLLDDLKLENVILISENEAISPSETLELMRLGSGYILSNSTFGWWGAFLSRQKSARVICPIPWFQGMSEPNELIPNHWQRIPI